MGKTRKKASEKLCYEEKKETVRFGRVGVAKIKTSNMCWKPLMHSIAGSQPRHTRRARASVCPRAEGSIRGKFGSAEGGKPVHSGRGSTAKKINHGGDFSSKRRRDLTHRRVTRGPRNLRKQLYSNTTRGQRPEQAVGRQPKRSQ